MNSHALFTTQDRATIFSACATLTDFYSIEVTPYFCAADGDEWAALCTPVDGVDEPFLSIQTTGDQLEPAALLDKTGRLITHGACDRLDLAGAFIASYSNEGQPH